MPAIKHLRNGAAAAADLEATRRSILRYLARYEREWGQDVVQLREWELVGCRPPEEDRKLLVRGHVRLALAQLVREGLLARELGPRSRHRWFSLTDAGRREAP